MGGEAGDGKSEAEQLCEDAGTFYEARLYERAAGLFERALSLDPGLDDARFYAGLSSYLLGSFVRAQFHWTALEKRRPDDFRLLERLHQAYEALGNTVKRDVYRKKLFDLRRAEAPDGEGAPAQFCRDQFPAGGGRVFAFERFELVERQGKNATRYHFQLASLDHKPQDRFLVLERSVAMTDFQRALGTIRSRAHVFALAGYRDEGRTHETFAVFDKGEPTYEECKVLVQEVLAGTRAPLSRSTRGR